MVIVGDDDNSAHPGFLANLPVQIEAEWQPDFGYLAGFPLNLLYSEFRGTDETGQPRVAMALYNFAYDSYREDEHRREMCYVPAEDSPYYVRVTYNKESQTWETLKYRGDRVICEAAGRNFDRAMIQTTIIGLQPDEPESKVEQTFQRRQLRIRN